MSTIFIFVAILASLIVLGLIVWIWSGIKNDSEIDLINQIEVETWILDRNARMWKLEKTESFEVWAKSKNMCISNFELKVLKGMEMYWGASWIYWKDTYGLPLPAHLQDSNMLKKMDTKDLLGPYGFEPLDERILR